MAFSSQEDVNTALTVTKDTFIKRVITDNEPIFGSGVVRFLFDVQYDPNKIPGMNHLKIIMPMAQLRKKLMEEYGVKEVGDVENYDEIFAKRYPNTPVTADGYHFDKLYTLQGVTNLTVGTDEDAEKAEKEKEAKKKKELNNYDKQGGKRYVKDKIGSFREVESDDSDFDDDFEKEFKKGSSGGTRYVRNDQGELVPEEEFGDHSDNDFDDDFEEDFGKKKSKKPKIALKSLVLTINIEDLLAVIPKGFPNIRIALNFKPLLILLPRKVQRITVASDGKDYVFPKTTSGVPATLPFGFKSAPKLLEETKIDRPLQSSYDRWRNFKDSDDEDEKEKEKKNKKEEAKIEEIKDDIPSVKLIEDSPAEPAKIEEILE